MYICMCNAFNDKQVDELLCKGVHTVSGIFNQLDCKPQCGRCVEYVRHMIRGHRCMPPVQELEGLTD